MFHFRLTFIALLFGVFLSNSCRTSREKVDVLSTGVDTQPTATGRDASGGPGSMQSSLLITQVTLPATVVSHKSIDVSVFPVDSSNIETEGKEYKTYKFGTPISLVALKSYRINVIAYDESGTVVAENRHCSTQLTFKAQFGQNRFTVPLCAPPPGARKRSSSSGS